MEEEEEEAPARRARAAAMEARPNKRARDEQPAVEPGAAALCDGSSSGGSSSSISSSSSSSSSSSAASAADAPPPSACPHCPHAHEPGTTCAACGHRWQRRAAAPGSGAESGGSSSSSGSSSSFPSSAAAGSASREELLALLAARDAQLAAALAERDAARAERDAARVAAPFRGPAADSVLGERLIDVIGIVAAMGFAADVAHCLCLCGETWRKGDRGATNDMLARSLERQCGASAARAAARENFADPTIGYTISGTTQLMRASALNNLPRVLQLVQLGAPLELKDKDGWTALNWACCLGHEHVARALLDGRYEGRGAEVDTQDRSYGTPLMRASRNGHEGVARLLLTRGARQDLQDSIGWTALHLAVNNKRAGTVALLCAAPSATAALALRDARGRTPLGKAIGRGFAACEAVLRAHGAPL